MCPPVSDEREIFICRGGPLDRLRLSVPVGVQWFLTASDAMIRGKHPSDQVVHIEHHHAMAALTNENWQFPIPTAVSTSTRYERQEFVTGEAGLLKIFAFQGATS